MPCYKCSNGKYKYGQKGNCQFDTLAACQAAERAIHAEENSKMEHGKPMKKPAKKPGKKPYKPM
jgi:hypothetical protein